MKKIALVVVGLIAVLMLMCAGFSVLSFLGGGGSSSSDYWTTACVTGDGKLMLAGGTESVVLELDTGKQLARHEQWGEKAACAQSDGVVYASSETMVRFPAGTQAPTDDERARDRVDGSAVHYSRSFSQKAWRSWGNVSAGGKSLELKPSMFGFSDEKSMNAFVTWPGNVLPDGRLVVLAGWRPNNLGSIEPTPWGAFAADAAAGTVQQLGAMHRSSEALNPLGLPKIAASRDGRVHAAALGGDPVVHVAIYEAGEQPRAVVDLDSAREATALRVSDDGAYIAVGTLAPGGSESHVAIIDAAKGVVVWRSEAASGTVYLTQFLADGSLVFMRSNRTAARVTPDGKTVWAQVTR